MTSRKIIMLGSNESRTPIGRKGLSKYDGLYAEVYGPIGFESDHTYKRPFVAGQLVLNGSGQFLLYGYKGEELELKDGRWQPTEGAGGLFGRWHYGLEPLSGNFVIKFPKLQPRRPNKFKLQLKDAA